MPEGLTKVHDDLGIDESDMMMFMMVLNVFMVILLK